MKRTKHLLIVESERSLIVPLREELEEEGFTVLLATTVDEAERKLEKENTAAVVIDLSNSDPNLVSLIRHIKSGEGINPTVIVLSDVGDELKVQQAVNTGADKCITKTRTDLKAIKREIVSLLD